MKLKEKWATDYKNECFRTFTSETDIQGAFIYGFDLAKRKLAEKAHNHFDDCVLAVDRKTILALGENEAGNEPE